MRAAAPGRRPGLRMAAAIGVLGAMVSVASGWAFWCWTQAAALVALRGVVPGGPAAAAAASWRLVAHGWWGEPARAFPSAAERAAVPGVWAYLLVAVVLAAAVGWLALCVHRRVRSIGSGSPLGMERMTLARVARDRGWVSERTWALPGDLRRLWVPGPVTGRPCLGVIGRSPARTLAAELEVQPMVVAPPRSGKTSGYVIPWLLEHRGPALVLSTKRDVYEATVGVRERHGPVWVFDPLGDAHSAGYSPVGSARSWPEAIRTGEALASAAKGPDGSDASEFWNREAASLVAPLLHAAALDGRGIGDLLGWLDVRDFDTPGGVLGRAGSQAAADQLAGVARRDPRNRETTVMSAQSLLRVYRHPDVAASATGELTPEVFLRERAGTIYVVAAGHHQDVLQPVILALLSAIYEGAIAKARRHGALEPRLLIAMDEAANIAPVRHLGSWLSQCGDHGIVIATIWQSIAQIDQRYGRAARDAIGAASTAQVFIPPIADPATSGYLTRLIGEESVAIPTSQGGGRRSVGTSRQPAAPAPWLRTVAPGRAVLVYRDLLPGVVRVPGWVMSQPSVRSETASRRTLPGMRARPGRP